MNSDHVFGGVTVLAAQAALVHIFAVHFPAEPAADWFTLACFVAGGTWYAGRAYLGRKSDAQVAVTPVAAAVSGSVPEPARAG